MSLHLSRFLPSNRSIGFWSGGKNEQLELSGECAFDFTKEKRCIGYNDGENIHICPIHSEGTKQCSLCAARDISRMYTRLDYSGFEQEYEEFRKQQFSVYLVSFAHILKCGVTRTFRLQERVTEQGADYFCELAKADDAETAYAIETMVQDHFPVRNALTWAHKIKLMQAEPSDSRMRDVLEKINASGILSGYEGEMKTGKLKYSAPNEFSESEIIDGKITGNRGQILFYSKEGKDFGINMSKKTGTLFSYSLTGS